MSKVPGFVSIYEWIDYWQSGNDQWKTDDFEMDRATRLELAWAAQSVSHMLATLRDIADMTPEKSNVYDAARVAKNAMLEYGLESGGNG
jgi:hypothetical protein